MTEYLFDHDRLDVYRLSIEYVATITSTSTAMLSTSTEKSQNKAIQRKASIGRF